MDDMKKAPTHELALAVTAAAAASLGMGGQMVVPLTRGDWPIRSRVTWLRSVLTSRRAEQVPIGIKSKGRLGAADRAALMAAAPKFRKTYRKRIGWLYV